MRFHETRVILKSDAVACLHSSTRLLSPGPFSVPFSCNPLLPSHAHLSAFLIAFTNVDATTVR